MTDKTWAVRGVSPTLIKRLKRDSKNRNHTLGFVLNTAIKSYLSTDQDDGEELTLNRLAALENEVRRLAKQPSPQSGVIWFVGLSGAGKTTICQALSKILKPRMPNLVVLDGDNLRAALGPVVGYTEEDRIHQFERVQRFAKEFENQGLFILIATLYCNEKLLKWNRANLKNYLEVLVDTPMELIRQRDPKGLYSMSEKGNIKNVVGVDIPWHEPKDCDLVIDGSFSILPEKLAHQVAEKYSYLVPITRK